MFFKKSFETLNLIEIDSESLLFNYDLVQNLAPQSEIWPVLKANAYGHGIKEVTKILEKRKFKYLIVDGYHEFLEIRKVTKRPVLIIGTVMPLNFSKMKWKNLTIMVQDIKTIKALGNLKKKITIHLKINTGMNRQGVGIDDLKRVINEIKKFKNLELEGMMSHLADADNSNNRYTLMQLDRFIEAIKIIEEEGIKLKCKHLSATAGVGKIQNPLINAVRLGIGLYGINPLNKKDKDYKKYTKLQPVLSFKSKLTKVEKIEKEEKVSYNGTYKTSKVTRIGIIPVGYYEGLDRRLSNVGLVKIQNKYCPIIGRVCMNLAVVDLGRIKAKAFEEVEIISKNSKDLNSISNMAAISHTIPYELLVKLNNSIRRAIR